MLMLQGWFHTLHKLIGKCTVIFLRPISIYYNEGIRKAIIWCLSKYNINFITLNMFNYFVAVTFKDTVVHSLSCNRLHLCLQKCYKTWTWASIKYTFNHARCFVCFWFRYPLGVTTIDILFFKAFLKVSVSSCDIGDLT